MNLEKQLELLDKITSISYGSLHNFDNNNTWFSTIDAGVLYGMVRHFKPHRIIEIGSGYSTECTLIALEDNGLPCRFTTIDPFQGRIVRHSPLLEIISKPLEEVDKEIFHELVNSSILFIDSSHIWHPGNDVDILYYKVLPNLVSGVIVHIHDIFLPDDYPVSAKLAAMDEQEHVKYLLDSGEWEILLSTYLIKKIVPKQLPFPNAESAGAGSLWIRKK
jgi:hypothetical protein